MSILKFSNFYQHPSKYASSTYIVGEGWREHYFIKTKPFIHRHAFYPRKGDPLYTHYCAHNASVQYTIHRSPFRGCIHPFMLWVPCNRLAYYTILYRAQFQPPCYYWEIIKNRKIKSSNTMPNRVLKPRPSPGSRTWDHSTDEAIQRLITTKIGRKDNLKLLISFEF